MSKNNNLNQVRPFGIKDKIGYMFGDFGNDFTFTFASSYLIVFYTNALGMSGAIVGLLFLIARFVDAFSDVAMGRIVDSVKPAWDGRFRCWIRRMSIPVVVLSMLMYLWFIRDLPYSVRVIYMFVTYLLWGSVGYTGINIPYGSMAAVISPNPKDRTSLSTFRSVGATLANLVISVMVPLIVYTTNASGHQVVVPRNFTILAIVFGVFAFICYRLCYHFVIERVQTPPQTKEQQVGVIEMFKGILSNRALLGVIVSALFLVLAQLLVGSMNQYLFLNYFNNTKMLSVVGLLTSILPLVIVAPFATTISTRFGKKETGCASVLIAAICYGLLFVLHTQNVILFIVITSIGMLGMGAFNMIIWAFITDVIDYQEVRTHRREDGTVYSIYSFSRKVSQALAGGISGFALTAIGYISTATVQTHAVNSSIYTISTLIPAICYFVVFLSMMFIYPLTKNKVLANTKELEERRQENKI